jgi:hypothetical protein
MLIFSLKSDANEMLSDDCFKSNSDEALNAGEKIIAIKQ